MRCLTGLLVLSCCFAVFAAGCNKDQAPVPGADEKSNTDTGKPKAKGKGLPQPPKIE
jgi:hypothetical protein